MTDITIDIKGRPWKFILMTDKRFDKLHNSNEENNIAMTVPSSYEVHFRKSDWTISAIRHELLHVIYNMSLVGSADLSVDDVIEICADIVGEHSFEIIMWADRIAEKFMGTT